MDKYFPSWLSAKSFLLASLLTAVGVFSQYAGYGFGVESILASSFLHSLAGSFGAGY